MFASFISFRDFTLYVIPGNISVYLFLKIIKYNGLNPFPYFENGFSSDYGILFIFVTVSSFIGFIQSQIIIKVFNWILDKSKTHPFKRKNWGIDETLFVNSMSKMKTIFNLNDNFKFTDSHFSFCNSFVLLRTNEHSYGYARRLINFSLFSTVIPIPISLSLYYMFIKLNVSGFWWILFSALIATIFYYCFKMTMNFRFLWMKNVLSLFLSLPKDNKL
jgi:hypothetical protein